MVKVGQADKNYRRVIDNILENGLPDDPKDVRPSFKDGTPATTLSVMNEYMQYDNSGDEAFLLTTKQCAKKDPLTEIDWIWQQMSNIVQDLRDAGCTVWDEWEQEDGTIGKAYGYQLANKKRKVVIDELFLDMYFNGEFSIKLKSGGDNTTPDTGTEQLRNLLMGKVVKLNQVDFLLYNLKNNATSRRITTTLNSIEDADEMALEACVYETRWKKWGGKVNLTVNIRSNDMALKLVPSDRNVSRTTLLKRGTLIA